MNNMNEVGSGILSLSSYYFNIYKMNNIFYCSNVQLQTFKFNTRSHFKNYVDIDNLNYLPDGDIEVAVKRIIFDIDVKINHKILFYFRQSCEKGCPDRNQRRNTK